MSEKIVCEKCEADLVRRWGADHPTYVCLNPRCELKGKQIIKAE